MFEPCILFKNNLKLVNILFGKYVLAFILSYFIRSFSINFYKANAI